MHWESVRLSVDDPNEFLVRTLTPIMDQAVAGGLIKRWFFIRYSDPFLHLRLRFQVRPAKSRQARRDLTRELQAVTKGIEDLPYSRVKDYYGETILSVYSELLNTYTTALAVQVLSQARNSRGAMMLWTLTAFDLVASAGRLNRLRLVQRLVAFAKECHEITPDDVIERYITYSPSALRVISQRSSSANGDLAPKAIKMSAHLLRRLCLLDGGERVGIHGLHLLFNKVGFTLADELRIYHLLEESIKND